MMRDMGSSVLIVDDHAGFRAAARSLLEQMGLDVVGEAESGEQAVAVAERLKPDVVLLDIQLPGIDGIEVARQLLSMSPSPIVVLTSTRDEDDFGTRLSAVPGAVFIGKTDLSQDAIAQAIGDST